jgi:uncharacterized membrane protein YfhO
VLVAVIDLWLFSTPLVRKTDLGMSQEKMELVRTLTDGGEVHRVVTRGDFFRSNDGLLYGYQDIQGYDPMILKRYLTYLNRSQNLDAAAYAVAVNVRYVSQLDNPLIRMLNVKYNVVGKETVLETRDILPRAFMVPRAEVLPESEILDSMLHEDFDPAKKIVFGPEYRSAVKRDAGAGEFETECVISHYDNEEIEVRASSNQGGYLFFSEVFYPGWEATVDGKKAEILRGNYLFRVVPLEAGTHEVKLRFVSWPFRTGAIVSLLALVLALWLIVKGQPVDQKQS